MLVTVRVYATAPPGVTALPGPVFTISRSGLPGFPVGALAQLVGAAANANGKLDVPVRT
ncbi:MAG: hypothetical protein NVSMB55_25130 [Mycobacteriales bacterium]